MLKSQSKCSKTIVILLVTILVALSMSALLQVTIPTQYFLSEEISTTELSNVSSIGASARSESEGSDNQIVASLNATSRQSEIDQSIAVKDADGQEKYLYVEFASGGYAIYDRIGQFVYERSDIGTGPFHNYINSDYEWYSVDELICNFGWATKDFAGCVYINNEVVADISNVPSQVMTFDNYINLNVF